MRSSNRSAFIARSLSVAERRFELEDAGGAARAQHPVDPRVVEGDLLDAAELVSCLRMSQTAVTRADRSTASWMTVSVFSPRKSIFNMPAFSRQFMSYCVTMMDSPSLPAGPFAALRADRYVIVERAGRDDDASRVHARVARQSFERRSSSRAVAGSAPRSRRAP